MSRPVRTFLLAAVFLLGGCGSTNVTTDGNFPFVHFYPTLLEKTDQATDRLIAGLDHSFPSGGPLLVASLANINNLEQSSTFGRVISEQIGGHLTDADFRVLDTRLRSRIFVKQGSGEFLLSREVREVSQTYDAAAVLVGTYAEADGSIYVSLRLVRSTDSLILSATSFTVPVTDRVGSMLGG